MSIQLTPLPSAVAAAEEYVASPTLIFVVSAAAAAARLLLLGTLRCFFELKNDDLIIECVTGISYLFPIKLALISPTYSTVRGGGGRGGRRRLRNRPRDRAMQSHASARAFLRPGLPPLSAVLGVLLNEYQWATSISGRAGRLVNSDAVTHLAGTAVS